MISLGGRTFQIREGDYIADYGSFIRFHSGALSLPITRDELNALEPYTVKRTEVQGEYANTIIKYYLSCTSPKNNSQNNTP